jgi:DNA-binding response OmpR family regulator
MGSRPRTTRRRRTEWDERLHDRVLGLDAGADDYLVEPFAFAELVVEGNEPQHTAGQRHRRAHLRRKVDADHPVRLIHTVRGVGLMVTDAEP